MGSEERKESLGKVIRGSVYFLFDWASRWHMRYAAVRFSSACG